MDDVLFLVFIAMAYGLSTAGCIIPGVFFIHFQYDLEASASQASLAVGLPYAALFLGGPLYSILSNFFGFKKSLIFATLLVGVGYMLTGLANSIELVQLFMGLLIGCGGGVYSIVAYSAVANVFEKQLSFANSVLSITAVTCALCLAPTTQAVISMFSWRWTVLMVGAFLLNAIPAVMLSHWFYVKRESHIGGSSRETDKVATTGDSLRFNKADEKSACAVEEVLSSDSTVTYSKRTTGRFSNILDLSILRDPCFVCYLFSTASCSMAIACQRLYLIRYAQDIGVDDTRAVWLFSINRAMYMVTCLLVGYATTYCSGHRPQRKKSNHNIGEMDSPVEQQGQGQFVLTRADVLIIAQFCTAASLLIPTVWEFYSGFLAYAVIGGIASGSVGVIPITVLSDLFESRKLSTVLGYRGFLTGVFTLGFPPFIGHLVDIYGSFKVAQYVCGILSFASAALTFLTQFLLNRRSRENVKSRLHVHNIT